YVINGQAKHGGTLAETAAGATPASGPPEAWVVSPIAGLLLARYPHNGSIVSYWEDSRMLIKNCLRSTLIAATALSPVAAAMTAAPAWGQEQYKLDEIITTATRREAAVQNVGITVSSLSNTELEKYSVADANELTAL